MCYVARPGFISLAGGLPLLTSSLRRDLALAAQSVLNEQPNILQYSLSEGLIELREWILERYRKQITGLSIENVLITHGSQQALDLLSKLFLDDGAEIVVENPTFIGALQTFSLFKAHLRPVEADSDGVLPDQLDRALSESRSKFFYAMPTFQNPTGHTWTLNRRKELCTILQGHHALLIEDNPYGEIWFDQQPPKNMIELCGLEHALLLISFSKTVVPGLRVGAIIGHRDLIRRLIQLKQAADLHTNTLGQAIINHFVRSTGYEDHLVKLRRAYWEAMHIMHGNLTKHIGEFAVWSEPKGGMFFWCRLKKKEIQTRSLLTLAVKKGVSFAPGEEFAVAPGHESSLRLNYTYSSSELIGQGIQILGECLQQMATPE